MGSSPNKRPIVASLDVGCRTIIYNQKGPMIVRTTRICFVLEMYGEHRHIEGLGFRSSWLTASHNRWISWGWRFRVWSFWLQIEV